MRDSGTGSEFTPRPPGSEFTPEELDLLEDALEWVGDPARGAEIDAMPAPVRARIDEYAAILALAREALPEEDVAPGLLDGILAEARQAAPTPTPREEGPGWWERLRRSFLLPGVALAGTAALLLWVARPVDEAPSVHDDEKSAAPAPAAPEAARELERGAPADAVEPDPSDMAPESDDRKDSSSQEAEPTPGAEQVPAAEAAIAEPPALKPSRGYGGGAPAKAKKAEAQAPLPGLDVDEETRVDADKESVRDRLESGDAARRKGNCEAAARDYAAVARSTGPAAERARALAGLGLCREAEGDESGAGRYFEEALRLDPGIEKWLRGEGDGPRKSTKKTSNAKSKAVADGL